MDGTSGETVKYVISASLRTDIPPFYSEWFIQRLREGEVYVQNPYGEKVYRVSLKLEDMHGIVFWSKNFSPLISRIEQVERITGNLFFHFTITGIPKDIEQHSPPHNEAIRDFIYLSERYSPRHVIWRFDPICITDRLPFEYYERLFTHCAEKMKGHCVKCYISFVKQYKKVILNFGKYTDQRLACVDPETQREYAKRLGRIAEENGMKLFACCNDHLLSDPVGKASCISGGELSQLFNDPFIPGERTPTRKECACSKSMDIGSYDTCPHGCLYCYANADRVRSQNVYESIDMKWNALGFHVEKEEAGEEKNT